MFGSSTPPRSAAALFGGGVLVVFPGVVSVSRSPASSSSSSMPSRVGLGPLSFIRSGVSTKGFQDEP